MKFISRSFHPAATAALFVASLWAAPGTAVADTTAFETETVIANGWWNNPSSTAVDERGVIHVAYMQQFSTDGNTKEIWNARKAPGETWQHVQITDNDVREEFPCIALDSEGNVHIAFHTGVVEGGNKIRYVNNIGQPIGEFNEIIDNTDAGFVITRIAVGDDGVVHFVFRTQFFGGIPQEIYYTTWSETGGVGELVNISITPGQEDSAAQIALDADGNVHIVWQRGSAFGGPLAYVTNANGDFDEVPTGVPGSVRDPFILIEESGRITIFFRPNVDALEYIEDEGDGFGPPQPVYEGTYRSAFYERFAVDVNGHRYVAFASNIAANRGTFFVRETAEGWLEPQLLAGEDGGNLGTSVAINNAGQLVVTYSISGFDQVVFADMFAALATIDLGETCVEDLTGDGLVDAFDLLVLLGDWGSCPDPSKCPADLNGDGTVDVFDLLLLLSAWGPC